ncbi:hypothetical protein TKK_0013448 [Trichogramma kaykai]|uniref:tRNA-dihydrouridine(16/17) synthase [NAD(P)(+)] n=1 Tax=Trichogramma kaykai TaxID=54128 RepID=A0ABD2WJ16_9HYME
MTMGSVEQMETTSNEDGKNVWRDVFGSPRFVVAPMVDASELAWRLLSRRHGAELCFTPMLHSTIFCRDANYRAAGLASSPEDRPLVVQFCGNDPDTLLKAALLAEPYCDAVDLNIGCPQAIAKRGHYGAYLQDDWELLTKIVSTVSKGMHKPFTCKLRVFPEMEKTIRYAKTLEAAGASMLTVHGRTREQKGPMTGIASWEHIKAIKEAVKIPVLANGNIQVAQDVERCIEETGVEGVMTAEGNLSNPFLFEGVYPPCWEPADEYLDLVERYTAPASYIRGHLFKMCHSVFLLSENADVRSILAQNSTMESFRTVVREIKNRYQPYHEGKVVWRGAKEDYNLTLPPWLCQPHVRDSPEEHVNKVESKKVELENAPKKRDYKDEDGNEISRKHMKKLRRIGRRPNRPEVHTKRGDNLCKNCPNPLGSKCEYKLCRQCCRNKCYSNNLDCPGHRNMTKTRRKMAIEFAAQRSNAENTEKSVDMVENTNTAS